MGKPLFSLKGLWTFPQTPQRDDALAVEMGYADARGGLQPHGMWTRKRFYRITMAAVNGIEHGGLFVFDEDGEFGFFLWDDSRDAWHSFTVCVPIDLQVLATNPFCDKGTRTSRVPKLVLTPWREKDFPRCGAAEGTPCPLPMEPIQSDPALAPGRLPMQVIRAPRQNMLLWSCPELKTELEFDKVFPQQPDKPAEPDHSKTWGDTFRGHSLPQITFPFCGFDPRRIRMDLPVSNTGTSYVPPAKDDTYQDFSGQPIFCFPPMDSYDLKRADLIPGTFLPLGVHAEQSDLVVRATHTQTISSLAERKRAWSLSVGLSAGAEGIMSVSTDVGYKKKLQEQEKTESRYTVTYEIGTRCVVSADYPTLRLHPDFLEAIRDRLAVLLQRPEESLRWDDFINRFGTHYAHAITWGHLNFMETRYSLQAQYKSFETQVDLKIKAEAALDTLKAGGTFSMSSLYGEKVGSEMDTTDITYRALGEKEGAPILFDLRPITDLLSPLFFPYDASEFGSALETVAPLIWYNLRSSLKQFLTGKGLNQALPASAAQSNAPRFFTITFSEFTTLFNGPTIYGSIGVVAATGLHLISGGWYVP